MGELEGKGGVNDVIRFRLQKIIKRKKNKCIYPENKFPRHIPRIILEASILTFTLGENLLRN